MSISTHHDMLPLLRVLTGGTSGSSGNGCAPYAKFKPATAKITNVP